MTDVRTGFVAADDGIQIHWRAVGQGPIIACANGVGVGTFFWKYVTRAFLDRFTVLTWDYRGHGRSDRRIDPRDMDLGVARHADDLAAVIEGVAGRRVPALLIGHSMGCQVVLEVRRRHPDLCAGLVLVLGTAGKALGTFFDNPRSPVYFKLAHKLIFGIGSASNEIARPLLESPLAWFVARKLKLVDPYYAPREDMLAYMHHLATLDLQLFIETVIRTDEHDAWDLLPTLDRPLLIIAAENDKFTPLWCSYKIQRDTPGAEILVLADASHAALIEQPDTINQRIERFLVERLPVWSTASTPEAEWDSRPTRRKVIPLR
jgi:pimeloyl-ACP methyl ester carboxylesterase